MWSAQDIDKTRNRDVSKPWPAMTTGTCSCSVLERQAGKHRGFCILAMLLRLLLSPLPGSLLHLQVLLHLLELGYQVVKHGSGPLAGVLQDNPA